MNPDKLAKLKAAYEREARIRELCQLARRSGATATELFASIKGNVIRQCTDPKRIRDALANVARIIRDEFKS